MKYPGNNILLVGKGNSLDLIDSTFFDSFLTIGLNNIEHKFPMDITILNRPWTTNTINSEGYNSQIYLTPEKINSESINQFICPKVENNTSIENKIISDEVYISEPLFLTALNICYKISAIRNKVQTIYFLGFDFNFELGFSKGLEIDFSGDPDETKKNIINSQIEVFFQIKNLSHKFKSVIKHVGVREFSDLTPAAFRIKMRNSKPDLIENIDVSQKVEITAEITTNHLGNLARAEEMILKSKLSGADFVKFQIRDVDSFYSPQELKSTYKSPFGNTYRDYRIGLEFSDEDFLQINEICKQLNIGWFASVLDMKSYQRALNLNCKMIKLPSTISEKKDYLRHVADNFKGNIVISTGMTGEDYASWIIDTFKIQDKIYLLHTNSAYPTPIMDCNIAVIKNYLRLSEKDNRIVPGYSSHDAGSFGSILAVACGARMIEKHVKLGSTDWLHFDKVALDLSKNEFRNYVNDIRNSVLALGSEIKHVTPSEHHKY